METTIGRYAFCVKAHLPLIFLEKNFFRTRHIRLDGKGEYAYRGITGASNAPPPGAEP